MRLLSISIGAYCFPVLLSSATRFPYQALRGPRLFWGLRCTLLSPMRFFPRWPDEQQKREAPGRIAILALAIGLTPALAFWLDWRLGVFIVAAYAALAFGLWRVSNQR